MRATRGSVDIDIRVIPAAGVEEEPVEQRDMRCPICHGEMLFEVPPCTDGHDECPELVCTGCGAAEVLMPITPRLWHRPRGRVAPHQRSAA
jgi:hypothetical protein